MFESYFSKVIFKNICIENIKISQSTNFKLLKAIKDCDLKPIFIKKSLKSTKKYINYESDDFKFLKVATKQKFTFLFTYNFKMQ